jgi:hypothetical protein
MLDYPLPNDATRDDDEPRAANPAIQAWHDHGTFDPDGNKLPDPGRKIPR